MKLRELEVEYYGILQDRSFEFCGDRLQVVYGPNEAGKSTLLSLLRQVLFGFGTRNAYQFPDHAGEMAATATLELADGRVLQYRRRKGRRQEVQGRIEPGGAAVDAAGLRALLGEASPELFSHVFAFSVHELSAGQQSLAESNVTEALFGGALGGLSGFQQTLEGLKKDHEQMYARGARAKRPLNVLLDQIRQQKSDLRGASVLPRDYEQACHEAERAEKERETSQIQLSRLQQQLARQQKLAEAYPLWKQALASRAERASLQVPESFPRDGSTRLEAACRTALALDEELDSLREERNETARELDSLETDPALLAEAAGIQRLAEEIEQARSFRRDIPLRRREAEELDSRALDRVTSILPDWDLETLAAFQRKRMQREKLEELCEAGEKLIQDAIELRSKRESNESEAGHLQRQLARQNACENLEELESTLDRVTLYRHHATRDEALQDQEARLQAAIDQSQQELGRLGALPDGEPRSWRVPAEPTIRSFQKQQETADQQLREARDQLAAAERSALEARCELQELEKQRDIPDPADLFEARRQRDELWGNISRWVNGDEPSPPPDQRQAATNQLGQLLLDTDALSDRLRANADLVAKREQRRLETQHALERLELAQQHLARAREEQRSFELAWNRQWSALPLEPADPDTMLEWWKGWKQLVSSREELATVQARRAEEQEQLAGYRSALAEALGGPVSDLEAGSKQLKRMLLSARDAHAQQKTLREQLERYRYNLEQADAARVDWELRQQRWKREWSELLLDLHLDASWEIRQLRSGLELLDQADQERRQAEALWQRVRDMTRGWEDFTARVQQLSERLAKDLKSREPDVTAQELHQRWQDARQADDRTKHLRASLGQLDRRLEQKRKQREEVEQTLKNLEQAAGVTDRQLLADVARQAERAAHLESQARQAEAALSALRGSLADSEWVRCLEETTSEQLQAGLDELQKGVEAAELAFRGACRTADETAARRDAIWHDRRPLQLVAELERSRGQLREQLDRWAPLVIAENLLCEALERFQHECQPELLRNTGDLFQAMTQGKYVRVQQKLDEHGTLQVQEAGGKWKDPSQLSTGTREQLYLAIRLAYVRHYCRQSEPLPLVLDDVLVNFDHLRARQTLELLRDLAGDIQILFFTCHRHIVQLIGQAAPDTAILSLEQAPDLEWSGTPFVS